MRDVTIFTGGAGFIGCALARNIGGRAGHIVAIDNMHPQVHKTSKRPVAMPEDVELVVADVRDAKFWDRFLAEYRPTTVVHLAAETGTGQSLTQATRHASTNVVGTTEMLDAFARAGNLPEHIILTSSRAIYGEGAWQAGSGEVFYPKLRDRRQLEQRIWNFMRDGVEAKPLPQRAAQIFANPASVYGATKLAQEHIVTAWGAAMKVPITIFRFQNVYGPGQSPFNPYTGIINVFHRKAYKGEVIDVYEDGLIGRDFVYIEDVANVVAVAMSKPPASMRILDVGTGVVTTILDAAHHIAALHGAPAPQISGKFRDGDVRSAVADIRDLVTDLGVCCETSFLDTGMPLVGEWLIASGGMQ
jgi:dTDP-L-rhamnose 4-epimerase